MKTKPREKTTKSGKLRRIVKIIAITLVGIIVLPIIALFVGRGVNDIRLRLPNGIREKTYIELGGVEQYINIRGADASNPVIIFLHGGGGGTTHILPVQQIVEADYTFIYWSQRDGGMTYVKSPDAELSLEIYLSDLDELVDYTTRRFNQPIILVGHSGGTRIGTLYAQAHPDKLAGYIGIGQISGADPIDEIKFIVSEAARFAREAGNEQDALRIEMLFGLWQDYFNDESSVIDTSMMEKLEELDSLINKYLPSPPQKDMTILGLLNPDFDWNSLRWELAVRMGINLGVDIDKYCEKMESAGEGFSQAPPENLDIPVVVINGSVDYATPAVFAQEYFERLTAPKKEIFILPGVGHQPWEEEGHFEIFSETLIKALAIVLN